MNIVRSMLEEKGVFRTFCPEAMKWAVHILNRCLTLVVQNMTPEQAWSGDKPSVSHCQIFECICYVHVPDVKRTKLEDKSTTCVLLSMSKGTKAYLMYDPIKKTIITSRDVIFYENKA